MLKNIFFKKQKKYYSKSFSQEGEDMILMRIFERQNNGFYVDVGALDPKRFSNTYHFYLKGWRGINIDATPGSMEKFKNERPEDINIECSISEVPSTLNFYMFNDPALNTFSKSRADKLFEKSEYYIIKEKKLTTKPLSSIFKQYLNNQKIIDFLSVDAEEFDFEVLKSNNWSEFQPKVVLVEALDKTLDNIENDPIYIFLKKHNYTLYCKTINTCIFINKKDLAFLIPRE